MDYSGIVAALDERVRDHAVALLCVLAYRGFGRLEVFSGRRTLEQQEILYGHGRSAEECKAVGVNPAYADPGGPVVTWSRPEDVGRSDTKGVPVAAVGCSGGDHERRYPFGEREEY